MGEALFSLFALVVFLVIWTVGGHGMWVVVAAGIAGFAGGSAYAIAHPLLRRLGRPGIFVTCWLGVGAYLGALIALIRSDDPASRHHWDLRDPVTWGVVAFCGVLFGSVIAAFLVDVEGAPRRRWVQRKQRVTSRVPPPSAR
jgi:MFS family permease